MAIYRRDICNCWRCAGLSDSRGGSLYSYGGMENHYGRMVEEYREEKEEREIWEE